MIFLVLTGAFFLSARNQCDYWPGLAIFVFLFA